MISYWLLTLVLLSVYLFSYYRKPAALQQNKVNWKPLETVGVVVAIYFGAQLAGAILVYIFPLLSGWSEKQILDWFEQSVFAQFALVTVVELMTLWLLYLFLKRRRASIKTLGLITPKLRDIGYALLGFAGYFVLYVALLAVAKALIPALNIDQEQQIGFDRATGLQLPLVFISLVLFPPFVEEIMARGFLYSGLKNGLPKYWAVIITSVLFAAAHLQFGNGAPLLWVAAIDTFTLSLVLIYLREKTGGLAAPIGLHMIKNGIAFLAVFVFA